MKIITLILVVFTLSSCASFDSGNIEYKSALFSPKSIEKDSVYVFVKGYSYDEGKLIFDTNFRNKNFAPAYISIFNNSSKNIRVEKANILNLVDIKIVQKKIKNAPFGYFLLWSLPWSINFIAGWPIYYGIAWPVFGFISMAQTKKANAKQESFYSSHYLEDVELKKGQEITGVVFLEKEHYYSLRIKLFQENGNELNYKFSLKSDMYKR